MTRFVFRTFVRVVDSSGVWYGTVIGSISMIVPDHGVITVPDSSDRREPVVEVNTRVGTR